MMSEQHQQQLLLPLSGVRILDLSRLYPGPLCTLLLADLGCEVIKIEEAEGGGDPVRHIPPLSEHDGGTSVMYHCLNRGKKSISLNLKSDSDRKQFLQLLTTANAVVESFRPGVLEKLFHTSDILQEFRQYKSNIILARISAYGQNAPDRTRYIPAHDMNSLAHAGVLGMKSMSNNSPLPIQGADLMSAYTCALQIVAALYAQKERSEEHSGTVIDVSMFDASLSSIMMPLSIVFATDAQVKVSGKDLLCGTIPCYDIYQCKSGQITVGCLEPHFWKAFIEILNLPEHMSSPQIMFTQGHRKDQVKLEIEKVLSRKTAEEWEFIFTQENQLNQQLPIIRVRQPEELVKEPLVDIRNMATSTKSNNSKNESDYIRVIKPALDYTSFLRNRGALNNQQMVARLGQHNEQILQSRL